jgi:hypothetical protein
VEEPFTEVANAFDEFILEPTEENLKVFVEICRTNLPTVKKHVLRKPEKTAASYLLSEELNTEISRILKQLHELHSKHLK